MPTNPRGRPTLTPTTRWGIFIHDRLARVGINRVILAQRLGVSPATVTRLLNGRVQAETIKLTRLCDALQLHGADQRAFLELIREALIAPRRGPAPDGAGGAGPRNVAEPTIVRNSRVDLDIYHANIEASIMALQGHQDPAELLRVFQRAHTSILRLVASGAVRESDPATLEIRMRSGMFLAALQEMVLKWWKDRPAISNQAYGTLAQDILPYLPSARQAGARDTRLDLLRMESLRLELRRAVLLREDKKHEDCDDILSHMSGDLRLERVLYDPADAVFIVAYTAQRVHTLAAENRYEDWRDELKRATDTVASAPVSEEERARLIAILRYAQGVGLKRFMWYARKHAGIRTSLAETAYETLRSLRVSGLGARATHDINLYHSDMPLFSVAPELECSEIDALMWIDARAAFSQAMSLLLRVRRLYPTLTNKIEDQINWSLDLLGLTESQKGEERRAWLADHAQQERTGA